MVLTSVASVAAGGWVSWPSRGGLGQRRGVASATSGEVFSASFFRVRAGRGLLVGQAEAPEVMTVPGPRTARRDAYQPRCR